LVVNGKQQKKDIIYIYIYLKPINEKAKRWMAINCPGQKTYGFNRQRLVEVLDSHFMSDSLKSICIL
jgi:hypothetical protein